MNIEKIPVEQKMKLIEFFHEGHSNDVIAEKLNELGFKTITGKEYSNGNVSNTLIALGIRRKKFGARPSRRKKNQPKNAAPVVVDSQHQRISQEVKVIKPLLGQLELPVYDERMVNDFCVKILTADIFTSKEKSILNALIAANKNEVINQLARGK